MEVEDGNGDFALLFCIYHSELLQGRTERIEDGGDVSS